MPTPPREKASAIVRRIMRVAPFSMRQLAEDAPAPIQCYSCLDQWPPNPPDENLNQLAAGLDARADRLRGLADELRRAAEEEEAEP